MPMTLARYAAGWGLLTTWFVPLAVAAVGVRRRLAPGWTGALARLAEAVLMLSAVLGIAQLLGAVGLLGALPMTVGCVVVGACGVLLVRRSPTRTRPRETVPPVGRIGWLVTGGVCTLTAVQWGVRVSDTLDTGVYQSDSLTYHLLYAYQFYRSGWTTHLMFNFPGIGASFHPADSELLHALGMLAFGRDALTPFLNLGWLALALLAGWCLGRRSGHGPTTVTAVALVLVTPVMSHSQPGSATSDTALIACLLTMAVFLLIACSHPQSRVALALAGAAGGLALSSKVTGIPVVAAATLLVPVFAAAGRRLASAITWAVPLLATGAFWYLRNLVRAGSPLPPAHLGPLPVSHQALLERYGYSIMSYATDVHVIRHSFLPGLRAGLGPLWYLLFGVAMAAVLLALRPSAPGPVRGIAVVAAIGALGYVVTPTTAFGARGHPVAFLVVSNLRYLLPAVALALPLAALVSPGYRRWQPVLLGVLVGTTAVTALWGPYSVVNDHTKRLVALTVGATVAVAALWVLRRHSRLPAAAVTAGALVVLVMGFPISRYYLGNRYAVAAPDAADPYQWSRGVHGVRIGMDGFTEGYVLTGTDLSNDVRYIGEVGPHASLRDFTNCRAYLHAVDAGGYRYLVFAPRLVLAPSGQESLRWPLTVDWVSRSAYVRLVFRSRMAVVYQVTDRLDPSTCRATPVATGSPLAASRRASVG